MAKAVFWSLFGSTVILLGIQLYLSMSAPFEATLSIFILLMILMFRLEYYLAGIWIVVWFVIMLHTGDNQFIAWWNTFIVWLNGFDSVQYKGGWGKY